MPSKKQWLDRARLYLILDTQVNTYDQLFEIMQQAVGAGVGIVQLRDKNGSASDMLGFIKKARTILKGRVPLIVNDRVDVALAGDASGVHLGQDDIPLGLARRMLGARKIIGRSCQTLAHVRAAERDGADYIGFGSVFKTLTKPDRQPMDVELLKAVIRAVRVPLFCIGGIGRGNIGNLTELGVTRVAVCRDVCQSADVVGTVRDLLNDLKR